MNRRRLSVILIAATLTATLGVLTATPANAATAQVLGRRAVTFQSPPTGTALAKWVSSSQGQFIDTNGNGLLDSLQGRGADLETFGITRFREDYVRLQALVGGVWVDKTVNGVDVVNGSPRAFAVIKTAPRRVCFATDTQRTYRVVHSVLFRRSVDSAVGRRTLVSNNFLARRLATDADCVAPPQGKLDLTLTANPPSPFVGEPFTLVAAAKNTGGRVVEEPTFTIDLPDTWTVADATVAGGTCTVNHTTNVITCTLGALLDAGAERDVSIHVTSAPADTFTLLGILSSTTEGVATDTATLTLTVRPSADLSVVKTATGVFPVADVDGDFSYVLTVDNTGPSSASGVLVTDTWPAGLDDPDLAGAPGCIFHDPDLTTDTGETITCAVASLTAADLPVVLTIGARTNGEASGDLTNTATVTSDTPDPDTTNNSDTLTIDVA